MTLLDSCFRRGRCWRCKAWSKGERFSRFPPCYALAILSSLLSLKPMPEPSMPSPVLAKSTARNALRRLWRGQLIFIPQVSVITSQRLFLSSLPGKVASSVVLWLIFLFPSQHLIIVNITCLWICSFVFPHENKSPRTVALWLSSSHCAWHVVGIQYLFFEWMNEWM